MLKVLWRSDLIFLKYLGLRQTEKHTHTHTDWHYSNLFKIFLINANQTLTTFDHYNQNVKLQQSTVPHQENFTYMDFHNFLNIFLLTFTRYIVFTFNSHPWEIIRRGDDWKVLCGLQGKLSERNWVSICFKKEMFLKIHGKSRQ